MANGDISYPRMNEGTKQVTQIVPWNCQSCTITTWRFASALRRCIGHGIWGSLSIVWPKRKYSVWWQSHFGQFLGRMGHSTWQGRQNSTRYLPVCSNEDLACQRWDGGSWISRHYDKKFWQIALQSVPLESIQKHSWKVQHYMFAYLEGVPGGSELDKLVKKYKTVVKAQRRISETPWAILFLTY